MKIKKPFFLFAALILSFTPLFTLKEARAVANTGFKAGYIMSNDVMANYNSMSLAQIQAFLKSQNPCNDTAIYRANYYPWVTYHVKDGHFVCMADDTFNGKSAARIIYDAAQTYKINPQVLIVLLQKEQGLVTDTWPNSQQYQAATGYGCPDTAACDARYYGLENQIMRAAELFRVVLDGGWSNYPVGWNYIRYNPNAACGGSNVYIRNRATSALYRYTPYQPNAATLAAGWGTASCGAYGNRNFYLYFTTWFGNPVATGNEVVSNPANSRDFTSYTPTKPTTQRISTAQIPASTIYLPDGQYTLSSPSGLALNVTSATSTLQPATNNNAQKFQIKRDSSSGFYTIYNSTAKRYLASSTNPTYGTAATLVTATNSCQAKWSLGLENSRYVFRSTCTAQSLGVAQDTSGASLHTYRHKTDEPLHSWALTALDSSPFVEKSGTFSLLTPQGLALTADGAGFGANLQINYKQDAATSQEFNFTRQSDGFFSITNPRANKAVAVASSNNNIHLVQPTTNSCAQKWFIESYNSHYIIRNACNGQALTVANRQIATSGANIQAAALDRFEGQLWSLTEPNLTRLTSVTYRITTPSLKSLDFDPNQIWRGAYLVKKGTSKTQEYKFTRTTDGYFTITNPQTNKLLTAGANFGTAITLQPANSSCQQKWFISTFQGYYALRPACMLRATLNAASANYYATINTTELLNTPMQKWRITKF